MTLAEAAKGKATDKGNGHNYLPFYEMLLSRFQHSREPILEIGIAEGGSLWMWADYFTNAEIVGCDILDRCMCLPMPRQVVRVVGDAYKPETLCELAVRGPYSVIVDDGPHSIESQEFFCRHYPGLLIEGGIAVIEDIQDPAYAVRLGPKVPSGFASALVDLRHTRGKGDDVLFLIWKPDR